MISNAKIECVNDFEKFLTDTFFIPRTGYLDANNLVNNPLSLSPIMMTTTLVHNIQYRPTENSVLFSKEDATMASLTDGAQYNAIALPSQSPAESPFSQIVDPSALGLGSPYGWHDTDGVVGPEYTITRGNNVHAYFALNEIFFRPGMPAFPLYSNLKSMSLNS